VSSKKVAVIAPFPELDQLYAQVLGVLIVTQESFEEKFQPRSQPNEGIAYATGNALLMPNPDICAIAFPVYWGRGCSQDLLSWRQHLIHESKDTR
jgi:hypothetical protein